VVRRSRSAEADPLRAFTRLAPWLVALLLVCGLGLLALQAGTIDTLVNSRYGVLIAIKIAVVIVLLAVAGFNRWRLTRPALAGDTPGERRMRVLIVAEIALFVPILAVTALLGTTIPPRSLAIAAIPPCSVPGPVTRSGTDIGLDIAVTFQSACSGRNNITLNMKWEDGHPLSVQEVMLQFSQPALNIEPFDVYLNGSGGSFSIANYALPLPGDWQVETRIVVDEYSLRRVVLHVPLAAS
jgi:copper transport protein